jgi:hypothetical protein
MKLLKNLAITGSLGMIAFAGLASASTISYDANLGSNGFYNGSGNTGDHFTILDDGNLQLALKVVNRYTGDPVLVPTGNNYDYNSSPNTDPTRQWGFYFSIDTNADNSGTSTIGDYSYTLDIFDNTTGTHSASGVFNPLSINDSASYDAGGITSGSANQAAYTGITYYDDQYGIQNAEWNGYTPFFGDGTPGSWNPNDIYTITLTAAPKAGGSTDVLTATVNATPEPGTILTMLGSLGALGLVVRRRKA